MEKQYIDWVIIIRQTNYRTIHTARGLCYGKVTEHFPQEGLSFVEESHLIESIVYDGSEIKDEEVVHITYINVTSALRKFAKALNFSPNF